MKGDRERAERLFREGCMAAERKACRRGQAMQATRPVDAPVGARDDAARKRLEAAIAPYRERALREYPAAKQRFLSKTLPKDAHVFVTVRLTDSDRRTEGVFVRVDEIAGGFVTGRIDSDLNVVRGYRRGEKVTVAEAELIDWTIALPDGTEEGNLAGKLLDTDRP